MQYFLKIPRYATVLAAAIVLLGSCKKVASPVAMGDAGQTLIKIINGGKPAVKLWSVDFANTPQTLLAADIRRDAPSNAELNKTVNVTIKDDTAAVKAYDNTLILLPAAWYTIQSPVTKVGGSGGSWSFVFAPGEFAKQISITIPNAQLLDPSESYGIAFTITSTDNGSKISTSRTIIYVIGAKNNWDGVYAVTGPMNDIVNPLLVQWNNSLANIVDPFCSAHGGAWELHLITTSGTNCDMFDNTIWGDRFHPIWASPGNSGYGSFSLVVTFNPATNAVSNVVNYYGQPAGNGRSARLDPSGVNAVQGNKDILIKYFMDQAPNFPRTRFDEKWE